MAQIYSHSYEDPETGETVDVLVDESDDDDDIDEYRNALPFRDRLLAKQLRRPAGGNGYIRPRPPRPRPRPYPYPRPRPPMYRERPPVVYQPQEPPRALKSPEHLSLRKSALAELIPAIGTVWASFLGVPESPKATGDDIVDRDNATTHRESLARHSQSQTRILALSDLASKAIKISTD